MISFTIISLVSGFATDDTDCRVSKLHQMYVEFPSLSPLIHMHDSSVRRSTTISNETSIYDTYIKLNFIGVLSDWVYSELLIRRLVMWQIWRFGLFHIYATLHYALINYTCSVLCTRNCSWKKLYCEYKRALLKNLPHNLFLTLLSTIAMNASERMR